MAERKDAAVLEGADGRARCFWAAAGDDEVMRAYHDEEWGRPVLEDDRLFERVCLEGFQSGLSWRTILLRREGFRRAFEGFALAKVARFTPRRVERLLEDEGIIRHRGKIESAIRNAARALELVKEAGSLAAYFARYAPAEARPPRRRADMVAVSAESVALSKDLKRRGFSFVGPTTMCALLQAVGLVNDHFEGCAARAASEEARAAWAKRRP